MNTISKRSIYSVLIIVALLLMSAITTFAQDNGSEVRFVHAIPDVSGVDIYANGELTITNLEFGEASGYIDVPAGTLSVTVTPPGLSTVLWQQDITIGEAPLTLIASSAQDLSFSAFEDNLSTIAVGSSRFSLIHAIDGAPAVSVTANGEAGPSLEYGQIAGTFDVPAGVYAFGIDAGDTSLIAETPLGFATSTSYMVIVYGTTTVPEVLTLAAPVAGDADSGFVRISHAVADAPDVDIYADGSLIVPALAFSTSTPHIALPANTYSVELRVAGTDTSLLTTDLTVESGVAATVAAVGSAEDLSVSVFVDDISGIDAGTTGLSVINTIPGESSVSVTLADGTSISEDLAFGESSGTVTIDPTTQAPTVTFTIDGQSATFDLDDQTFYGGIYYNVFAVNATMFTPPSLIFEPTNLSQGIGSAPGADESMLTTDTSTTTDAAETTTEDTTSTDTETTTTEDTTTAQVQPTQAPLPTVPPVVEEDLPTARILLDPGVNLQLRQFPSSDALSLGLAPSGSTVIINGREGAPIDIVTGEEIIEEGQEAFVDPATLLTDEDEDLPAEETWVNFTYPTSDGGSITAWTIALFLDIRTPDGDIQRLADLELVPSNQPGEAVATDVTPPPIQVDRVTVEVFGLDPDANLNVRRTPETSGEVLARIPNGTVADFVGAGESDNWTFISISPAEGGNITGWVSTTFLSYQLNGESITIEELQERNLFPSADETVAIGEISEGAPPLAQPTVDPLEDAFVADVQLDPGANLNLRRSPDAQSEVVAQIPSGSRVIVTGRTADSEWLQASFEGQVGWVASPFVLLTFNGTFVDIEDVPVIETDDTDTTETEEENAG